MIAARAAKVRFLSGDFAKIENQPGPANTGKQKAKLTRKF